MAEKGSKKPRIDISIGIMLVMLALVFDLMQSGAVALTGFIAVTTVGLGLAPGIAVNSFMNLIGSIFFGLIFFKLDVLSARKLLFGGSIVLVEFIPFINILPAWTAYVVGMVIVSRIEDGDSILAKTVAKASKPGFKEQPRNKRNKEKEMRKKRAVERREEMRKAA
ncbi:MAG: hypothetical protein Q8P93_04410 [bacterium]|nr:hypothetical protein [bacterium]